LRQALLGAARAGLRPTEDLAPFVPALATLVPEWAPAAATAEPNPVVVAEGILRFLVSLVHGNASPLLLVEDAHWADRETVAVLDYLADNLPGCPLMAVATLRTGEEGAGAQLVTDLLTRRVATPIDLVPLHDTQVAAMVAACLATRSAPAGLTERVAERSDGVPFFVEELLATTVEADGQTSRLLPVSIAAAVEQRLSTLPDMTAELVRHAALLGRHFDWELPAAATGCDLDVAPARLRDAVRAQLLEVDGAGFRFRHALTVDAIVQSLLPAERQRAASRLLAALTRQHPDLAGEHCQLAASLAEKAGDEDRAADLSVAAARLAAAQGSLATAEALAGQARGRRPQAADLVLLDVLNLAGQPDRVADTGRRLLGELADPLVVADVRLAMARAAMAAGRWDQADDHLAAARAAVSEDRNRLARILAAVAAAAMGRDDAATALPLARQALVEGEATDQPEVQCEALEVIGRAERGRDIAAAEAAFDLDHRVASEHGLAVWRIRAMQELGTIDMFQTLATGRLEEARREALQAGAVATAAVVDLQLAAVYNERGEVEAALEAARRCEDASRRFKLSTLAMSLAQQAMAHARAGDGARMNAAARAARTSGQDTRNVEISLWGNAIAVYQLGRGDLQAAAAALDRSLESLRDLPGGAYPFPGLWALVRTVLDSRGGPARAEVRALPFDTPISGHFLAAADAVAAGRAGERSVAEERFDSADTGLARYQGGFRRSLMRLLVAPGASAGGWGHPPGWLRQALASFEVLGLKPMAAACRTALRDLGQPVPRTVRAGEAKGAPVPPVLAAMGITGREVEVLAQLAAGRSNRAISEALFVSVRTVEKHVERLLMKSGCTRTELPALAARAGIQPPD
jgi:DNA-binding CsgD family transcriptional regulator